MFYILNTQVPRYLLFYEGDIFSVHALTFVGKKSYTLYKDNVVNAAYKYILITLQVSIA